MYVAFTCLAALSEFALEPEMLPVYSEYVSRKALEVNGAVIEITPETVEFLRANIVLGMQYARTVLAGLEARGEDFV
jgi:hypothetical protein